MSSDDALFNQRSLWGVNPHLVENLMANHRREVASLQARIAELESRPVAGTAPEDAASLRVSDDHAAVQNRIVQLEARLSDALAQMHVIEEAASRYRSAAHLRALREEAVQAVADAQATAQTIEERTRQLVERTRATLWADADAMRAQLEDEHTRHRAEIERLEARHAEMLRQLETTARDLRDHPAHDEGDALPPAEASYTDHDPDTRAADALVAQADVAAPPAAMEQVGDARRVPVPPITAQGALVDATTLSNALDELEALLNLPRDRWHDRPNDAAPATTETATRTGPGGAPA